LATPAPQPGEIQVPVGPPIATLALEIVDAAAPRGTIFVLHGIRAQRGDFRPWADMLVGAGFRVVLVDLRGHGRSTGDWLTYGVVESRDLSQVLDALDARGLRAGPVGVMGFSYGAAVAIEWAGDDPRVEAVVAVAPFASLRTVVPGYTLLPLPRSFVNGAIDAGGREAGFDPDRASPLLAIARTRAQILLIHGEEDHRIPAWHSRLLFAAATDAELVLVPGAGHLSMLEEAVIRRRVPPWFAAHLGATPGAEMP
jgi:pimeloyl-ACP methyl ester carboxylesterase